MAVDSHSSSLNNSGSSVPSTTTTTTTSSSQQQQQQPNIPTLFGTSTERIDLTPLKKQLDAILKENSETYWDWIRKFFAGKLSKIELDYYVRLYITDNNLHLHNSFFKAILQNALYAKTPPPISQENRLKRKSSSTTSTTTATPKSSSSSKEKSSSSSSKKADKKKEATEKGKAQPSKKLRPSKRSTSTSNLTQSSTAASLKSKHLYPKYLFYASEIKPLKSKMESIAEEQGLTGISKQAILYMKFAMEQYLSNILSNTVPHYKSSNLLPITSPSSSSSSSPSLTSINNDNNNNSNNNISKLNQQLPPSHLLYQYEYDLNNNNNNNNSNIIDYQNESQIQQQDNKNIKEDSNIDNISIPSLDENTSQSDFNSSSMTDIETSTTATTDISNCNSNNNNNNIIDNSLVSNYNPHKIVNFSSIFDFNTFNQNQQQQQQNQQYPQQQQVKTNQSKYIQSTNPLLSQKMSFYRIPEDIFTFNTDNTFISQAPFSSITLQDLYNTIENNPLLLKDDQLSIERINLSRF